MKTITYYELSNHNADILVSRTFDLEGVTAEEHAEEIQDWLKELTEEHRSKRPGDPATPYEEWRVADFEGIPENLVGAYAIDPDYWELARIIDESDLSEEVVMAFVECYWIPESGSEVRDAYQGQYKSDIDFAQEFAESLGLVPETHTWPASCIDWEQAARELMYDYSESDGHYFRDQ